MCGIAVLITCRGTPPLPNWPFWRGSTPSSTQSTTPLPFSALLPPLQLRGPDATDTHQISISPHVTLHTVSTALALRPSPHHKSPNILLFNGELYDLPPHQSDTQHLHALLDRVTDSAHLAPHHVDALRGPWAFIYWHAASKILYFARDPIGRRSLQIAICPDKQVVITSVPPANAAGFLEIPPAGIACLNFAAPDNPVLQLIPRPSYPVKPLRPSDVSQNHPEDNHRLVSGSTLDMYISFLPSNYLRTAPTIPTIHRSPNLSTSDSTTAFLSIFSRSIQRRLATCRQTDPSPYALLFSGGLDSLFIAYMLCKYMPTEQPLQLINVAFGKDSTAISNCPDRKSAILALDELAALQNRRAIQLICVDVPPTVADDTLKQHVKHLIRPCDQPMDASIGTALWLAARGQGYVHGNGRQVNIKSPILFSGLGADELMGGYKGRHRTIFRNHGVQGISREMDADLSRLWFRNLGRDDRLVASHGKELRHPFLDEDVIQYVTALPLVEHVCDLSKEDGVGDKHLLRRSMASLGFSSETVQRKKRAIQFGSRSKQVIERKGAR